MYLLAICCNNFILCYIGSIDNSRCIVQYWFESGKEHRIPVKPHGNNKLRKQPFCRTHPSTMALIKKEAENCAPKDAVGAVYKKQGGIMGATSIGELPRNRQQISNVAARLVPIPQFVVAKVYEIHCLWSWSRASYVSLETNLLE